MERRVLTRLRARLARILRLGRWERLHAGPGQLVTKPTRHGTFTFDTRDSVIAKHLFIYGSYEIELIDKVVMLLDRSGRPLSGTGMVVDVGANIGTTTAGFLMKNLFSRAVAIEPGRENFYLLKRNIEQNRLGDRVMAMRVALGATAGEVELELSADNFGDHRVRHDNRPGDLGEAGRGTESVRMARLDDLLRKELKVAPADVELLWIDAQGYEGHVFRGAPALLSSGVPVVAELWPYGIERSGFQRVEYLEILATYFSAFYDLRSTTLDAVDIRDAARLFDQHHGANAFTELLLVA